MYEGLFANIYYKVVLFSDIKSNKRLKVYIWLICTIIVINDRPYQKLRNLMFKMLVVQNSIGQKLNLNPFVNVLN